MFANEEARPQPDIRDTRQPWRNYWNSLSFRLLIENPDLRAALESEEDEEDNRLIRSFYSFVLTGWQYSFGEYEAGMIDEEDLDPSGWGQWLHGLPGMLSWWERVKGT